MCTTLSQAVACTPIGQPGCLRAKDFFLPVRALSKLFRAAFRRGLQKVKLFDKVPSKVWTQEWVVHCEPVGDGQAALKYLAPYIHRVAISNRRLLAFDNRGSMESSQVTFQYRASDTGQLKKCTLSVEQFFQRFLQHVLPHAFVKVRYYGFFGASVRRKLAPLQKLLGKSSLILLSQRPLLLRQNLTLLPKYFAQPAVCP